MGTTPTQANRAMITLQTRLRHWPWRCRRGAVAAALPPVRILAVCSLLFGAPFAAAEDPSSPPTAASIRIGIGPGTWHGINPNDAQAAMTAWARTILEQRQIAVGVDAQLFETTEAMRNALRSGQIDAVTMLADQFLSMDPELQPDEIFVARQSHSFTERYAVVVHQAGGITNVGALSGRAMVLQTGARTCLGSPWLDTLLAQERLGPAEKVLKTLTRVDSPSKAVLQVFFHQADACLVTSNVFDMACELNPQLRKDLSVLALSPEVVSSMFFFRRGYVSSARDRLEPAILKLHETPAGLQVLTVFQSDGMVKQPLTCLEGSRHLLAEYDRARMRLGGGKE